MQGLATLLGKAFTRQEGDAVAQVLVRCARLAGETGQQKALLLQEGVLAGLAELALLHNESGDTSLARAIAKCLAALSLGGNAAEGEVLVGAAPALVRWVQLGGKVREHSLAAIVNMSEICWLRPRLGNDGVIGALVAEYSRVEGKMLSCVVTALCLYCRESVNRVKLREGGGCKLLVEVLVSRQPAILDLHDRVINSLLQFIYDNHSLNVLMDCGLVFALVALLEEHMEQVREGREGQACLCVGETGEEEKSGEIIEAAKKSNEGGADNGSGEAESMKVDERPFGMSQKKDKAAVEVPAENNSDCIQDDEDGKFPSATLGQQATVEVDKPGTPRSSRPDPVFRLTSPSYQAVHWELEQFRQLREARAGGAGGGGGLISSGYSPCPSPEWAPTSPSSLCLSPDRSPPSLSCHYSPAHSTSSSTSHSYSPTYSSYSPSSSPAYSPQEPSYSPVENFSDEEESETPVEEPQPHPTCPMAASPEAGPSSRLEPCKRPPQSPSSPPASKRSTPTYLGLPFPIPSSSSSSPPRPTPVRPPRYNQSSSSLLTSPPLQRQPRSVDLTPRPAPSQGSRLTWVLQLLSRLTQADRPHADLTSERTIAAVFTFISQVPDGVSKAGKILTRLSTNLHCLLPFILHRHLPFFLLAGDRLSPLSSCTSCLPHLREVQKLVSQLSNNLSLLAETGYGEGEVCHRLVAPNTPAEEKLNIAICAPLLLRQRKLLRNVLVTHDSLDYLLDFLETAEAKADEEGEEDAQCLFTQAVVSLAHLAKHLGVQAPKPLLECDSEECSSAEWKHEHDITLLLDSGDSVEASRSVLTNASPVFAAMLAGGFSESGFTEVPLPLTSLPALNCLLHHLYGCPAPCPNFRQLPIPTLLELVSLSDKFLLADLNLAITSCIVRRCLGAGTDLPLVYRLALQRDYPVPGSTLAQATVCLSLVCEVDCWQRANMVRSIVTSDMKGDYIDDVGKLLRAKLFEKP